MLSELLIALLPLLTLIPLHDLTIKSEFNKRINEANVIVIDNINKGENLYENMIPNFRVICDMDLENIKGNIIEYQIMYTSKLLITNEYPVKLFEYNIF